MSKLNWPFILLLIWSAYFQIFILVAIHRILVSIYNVPAVLGALLLSFVLGLTVTQEMIYRESEQDKCETN